MPCPIYHILLCGVHFGWTLRGLGMNDKWEEEGGEGWGAKGRI